MKNKTSVVKQLYRLSIEPRVIDQISKLAARTGEPKSRLATRLFTEALGGQLNDAGDDTAELAWPGGKRIRLVREDGLPLGGLLHHVRFTRADGAFSAQDQERAGLLAKRLGLTVELAG